MKINILMEDKIMGSWKKEQTANCQKRESLIVSKIEKAQDLNNVLEMTSYKYS